MIQLATPATPTVSLIPMHLISTDPQIRMRNGFDAESIEQLANSIARHGLLQPIMIRASEGAYTILAGHRRFMAMQKLAFADAPALIADSDDEQAFERQLTENIQREALTLADTADAIRTLSYVHDSKEIAKIVGKSKSWVSKHLTLTANTFPALIRSLLDDGHTEDLELLLALHQVKKLDSSTKVYVSLLNQLRAGKAGRVDVRRALDRLKEPPINTDADPHAGDNEDDSDSGFIAGRVEVSFTLTPDQHDLYESLGGAAWIRRQLKAAAK